MISMVRSDQTTAIRTSEIEGVSAAIALGRREALPTAQLGARGSGGDRRCVIGTACRIQPETISPTMTTAMIASTMVSTKS